MGRQRLVHPLIRGEMEKGVSRLVGWGVSERGRDEERRGGQVRMCDRRRRTENGEDEKKTEKKKDGEEATKACEKRSKEKGRVGPTRRCAPCVGPEAGGKTHLGIVLTAKNEPSDLRFARLTVP